MLSDKVIVITGGAGLIGSEFSDAVLRHNGTAIIADSNLKAAELCAGDLKKKYPKAKVEVLDLDISNINSILTAIKSLDTKFQRIDALVNNAYPRNANYGRKFEDVTYEDFCQNISLNLGGYFLISQQFLKYFTHQGYGRIINISSIYGVVPPKFEIYDETEMTMPVEYAAIKSALIHLTKYMAKYYKGKNIQINALSLGGIKNNQPDKFQDAYKRCCLNKGMLDKTDISETLVFLLSESSKYINGQNIIIDDGFTL